MNTGGLKENFKLDEESFISNKGTYFNAVNEAIKVAEPRPNVTYWDTVDKALNDALREIAIEDKDVKETLDKYAKIIEEAKNK